MADQPPRPDEWATWSLIIGICLGIIITLLAGRLILRAQAQGPTGHCGGCDYQGSGWQRVGASAGDPSGIPPLTLWNCPQCHSTRVTMVGNMVPGGVNPWTGRGPTAWRGGGGYYIRPFEDRWSRWAR